ncbi:hypothetical protein HMPREF1529_02111 [Microbacterium sp. oral taxon 186 str. F0373]|uniref:Uncharacterized protein n=2 Tax=Microbacteriaceae TaxID=85023 RepID=A0A2K9DLZ1_9MICO|nr:hypothetical protein CXR34_07905 [Microbacterium hominis]EPD84071.1 hypothetical protein HMPREF1529_02111 [Microbacterium sp. oral taxon 186 str. F0373]
MARRGGFSHNYDAAAMLRFTADAEAVARVGAALSEGVLLAIEQTIDVLAEDLATEHGIHHAVARLYVAQRAAEATDFLRWVKAGEARGEGMPVRGLMDAMGYSSPTSISRMVPTIDHVGAVRARVDATGTPQAIEDDRGYTLTLHPRSTAAETIEQARKRGLLRDDG